MCKIYQSLLADDAGRSTLWLLAFCALLFLSAPGRGQTVNANILGTVTDTTGAVIPNVSVTAKNVATGMTFHTVTNGVGAYALRGLQIGSYTVTFSGSGFRTKLIGPFPLEVAQNATVNTTLAAGSATSTIQVQANFIPLLNTTNHTLATTFSSRAIETFPLNGRNYSSLMIFLPGAVAGSPASFNGSSGNQRNTGQSGTVSVNGNRNQTNNYTLDGIDINESVNNLIGYNPSPNTIGQLKVISANAPAQYGNVNGGDILAVTKTGTNHWHDSAYYFLQNYLLDANTWTNKNRPAGEIVPRTHETENTFGGTVGGPILKNKLFVFAGYEGFRFPTSGLGLASVPTAAMRAGDFSALDHQLYNNTNIATTGAVPYPNNQIPIVNPAAKYLFSHPDALPLPNATPTAGLLFDNYTAPTAGASDDNKWTVNVTYQPESRDTIDVRWFQGRPTSGTRVPVLPISFPGLSSYPSKGISINEVHAFSPSLVNEFLAGYTRVRWQQGFPIDTSGLFGLKGNALLGIGAVQSFPGFASLNFSCNGMAGCNSNNLSSNYGNAAIDAEINNNTFQYGDNITWMLGNHTIQAGLEILRYQQNGFYGGNDGIMGVINYFPAATMDVATGQAGNALADFELNDASFVGRGGVTASGEPAGTEGQRQYRDAFYVQDDWKIRPNLTLNLGVRYGYDQPIYEVNNKQSNINIETKKIERAGIDGASRALYNPTYDDVMPRVGFNYQIKTGIVLHGGFGMTTDLEGTGQNLRLPFNPPYWNEFSGTGSLPTATSPGSFFPVQDGFSSGSAGSLIGSEFRMWYSIQPAMTDEFSLATEIALTNTTSLKVGYVGEVGHHLVQAVNNNQLKTPCAVNGVIGDFNPTSPQCEAVDPAPFASVVGQSGSVIGTTTEGFMSYNALQITVRHRLSSGLEYTVNYSWSKALTDTPGFFGGNGVSGPSPFAQNPYNPEAEYGPMASNVKNDINGNADYALPFGRGKKFGSNWNRALDEVAGGWNLAGTVLWYSGFPVTINGTDNSFTGARAARPNQYRSLRIRNRSAKHWFGTDPSAVGCKERGVDNGVCAYGNTALGTFGDARVGTETAPGFQQVDLSLFKSFRTFGDENLQLRVDAFNAFNITSLGNPDNGYADASFGDITSVRSIPRTPQLSASYHF